MRRAAAAIFLAGCASATATIANEANDVRGAAVRARAHLNAAQGELDEIEQSAAEVHSSIAYVSDEESPVWGAVKFLSVAVVAGCIAAVVYRIKK
jgi:heterodisulfide reductase subunit A-like polyferredoxin